MAQAGKSEQTKALIMRAAISHFVEKGFEGSSLRDIAMEAGANTGLIRYHFGAKEDLYRDSLAHVAEPYHEACYAALAELTEPYELRLLIFAWLAAPFTHWPAGAPVTGEDALCFLHRMAYEPAELTQGVYSAHYAEHFEHWLQLLRARSRAMTASDWLWFLSKLRGMYFGMVAQRGSSLWLLPPIQDKLGALEQLSFELADQLQ